MGAFLLTSAAQATSFVANVAAGTYTNVLSFSPNLGSVTIKNLVIASPATGTAALTFIDAPTNSLTYTNAAYNVRATYATNYISTWTNFYGVTQSWTNLALIDWTNTVPAGTNFYQAKFVASVNTNTTVAYTAINIYFDSGVWVTNSGTAGTTAVTVTY